jgi:F-type H+-transporting ATPase subunit epsilon
MPGLTYLEIITPGKVLFDGDILSVTAPGYEGSFQVLPRHAPFITMMTPGKVKVVMKDESVLLFAVSGGTVEVKDNHITMLADFIVSKDEIDIAEVQQEITEAENQINLKEPGIDKEALIHQLKFAKAKLKVL